MLVITASRAKLLTSAEYMDPSTVCSLPTLSEAPQWAWNCSRANFELRGPPVNAGGGLDIESRYKENGENKGKLAT